jgi:hypothetical protein
MKARAAGGRPLTQGEKDLARSLFGDAIDNARDRVHRRKWFPLHPRRAIMAPDGHLWVHPGSDLWSEDYAREPFHLQGLFVHEMTHVWQAQKRGRWYLPLMRHPFCRYGYRYIPGRRFDRYGIEQQGEIVRDLFLSRLGLSPAGGPELGQLELLLKDQLKSGRG